MSRINYCEDEDFNNQSLLWEANQERAIRGRKGQAALRELEQALLALPEKKLIVDELENAQGEVCAIGALAKFKGRENPRVNWGDTPVDEPLADGVILPDEVQEVTLDLAESLGVPRLVALAVIYENDERAYALDPTLRYGRLLRWTRHALSGQYGWLTKKGTRDASRR
jgi:hypothetical protein